MFDNSDSSDGLPLAVDIVISAVIFLTITVGNALTIMAMASCRRLRTVANMYVTSLAVADLLVGVCVLWHVFWVLPATAEHFDHEEACLIYTCVIYTLMTLSTLSMMLIAFDRFVYIEYPLHYVSLMSGRRVLCVIVASWIAAAVYGTVPVYTSHYAHDTGCQPTHFIAEMYMCVGIPVLFSVVLVVSTILYAFILKSVLRQRRLIHDQSVATISVSQKIKESKERRRNYKAVKMLLMVFGLFFICWVPLVVVLALEYTVHVPHVYITVCIYIAVLHSAVNFIVYAAMNRDFRRTFRHIL